MRAVTAGARIPHPHPQQCGVILDEDGAVFVLDVGSSLSWPGSGPTIFNTIRAPADGETSAAYDFTLGAEGVLANQIPRYEGGPGDCGGYFYGNINPPNSFLLQLAGAQTAFLQSMCRPGAQFTIEAWLMTHGPRPGFGTVPLFDSGTSNQGGSRLGKGVGYMELGWDFHAASEHCIAVNWAIEGGTIPLFKVADAQVSADQVHMVACSIDATGGQPSFLYKDGGYDPVGGQNTWSGVYATDAGASLNKATINARADTIYASPRTRLYLLRCYDRALSKSELDNHWGRLRGRWGL